jgi:hypothetical protein
MLLPRSSTSIRCSVSVTQLGGKPLVAAAQRYSEHHRHTLSGPAATGVECVADGSSDRVDQKVLGADVVFGAGCQQAGGNTHWPRAVAEIVRHRDLTVGWFSPPKSPAAAVATQAASCHGVQPGEEFPHRSSRSKSTSQGLRSSRPLATRNTRRRWATPKCWASSTRHAMRRRGPDT